MSRDSAKYKSRAGQDSFFSSRAADLTVFTRVLSLDVEVVEERNPIPLEVERVLPAPFPPFSCTRALLLSWPRKGAADPASAFQSRGRFLVRPLPSLFPFLDLEKAAGHGRRRVRTNARYVAYTRGHDRRRHSRSLMSLARRSTCDNSSIKLINEKSILVEKKKKLIELLMSRVISAISHFPTWK